jgi:transketolase
VAVEAQAGATWWKYVGLDGRVIAMESFGASAPAGKLFQHFGFTVENVVKQSLELL